MEPTPVAPAPAKKSSVGMIIAIIVVAILSLCCCLPEIFNLLSPAAVQSSGLMGNNSVTVSPLYGLICVCAAIIPWIVLGIVVLIRRPKKQ